MEECFRLCPECWLWFLEISAKKTREVDLAFKNIVRKLRERTNRTRTGGWRWLRYISLTINKLFIIQGSMSWLVVSFLFHSLPHPPFRCIRFFFISNIILSKQQYVSNSMSMCAKRFTNSEIHTRISAAVPVGAVIERTWSMSYQKERF